MVLSDFTNILQGYFHWRWDNHVTASAPMKQPCKMWANKNPRRTDDIDGLVQERRNSIANALELRHSCTNPSIYNHEKSAQKVGISYAMSLYTTIYTRNQSKQTGASFYYQRLTGGRGWISNYVHGIQWVVITDPCLDFNGGSAKSAVEVRAWIRNYIP